MRLFARGNGICKCYVCSRGKDRTVRDLVDNEPGLRLLCELRMEVGLCKCVVN